MLRIKTNNIYGKISVSERTIEKFIAHQPIKSAISYFDDPMKRATVEVKHITIPEARLVVAMTPACRHEWEYIKTMTPRVSPEYFIEMAYKEYMERKNAETN